MKKGDAPGSMRAQAARFLGSGAATTIFSYLVYLGLQLLLPYQAAYAIAFLAGIALSYALNLRFVFRARHSTGKALAFPLVYLLQYALGALLLAALVEWFGMPQEVAPIAVIVATLPITFVLARRVLSG